MKDKRQRQTSMCNGFLVDQITLQSLALMMHTVNSMNQQILSVQGMAAANPSQALQALTSLQQMTIPPNLVSWLRTHLSMHQQQNQNSTTSENNNNNNLNPVLPENGVNNSIMSNLMKQNSKPNVTGQTQGCA